MFKHFHVFCGLFGIAWNFFHGIFMYPQIDYVRYLDEGFYIKINDWWDGFYF